MAVRGPKTVDEFMALPVEQDFLELVVTEQNQAEFIDRYPDMPNLRIGHTIQQRIAPRFVLQCTDGDTVMFVRTPEGLWTLGMGGGRRLMSV